MNRGDELSVLVAYLPFLAIGVFFGGLVWWLSRWEKKLESDRLDVLMQKDAEIARLLAEQERLQRDLVRARALADKL